MKGWLIVVFAAAVLAADAIGDLTARINAENGTALAELIRLNAIQMQQTASVQNQNLVDETNMKRQTQYQDYAFGELPTE